MKTVTDITPFQKLPVLERREWYIPESLTTTFGIEDCEEEIVCLQELARIHEISMIFEAVNPNEERLYLRHGAAQRLMAAATAFSIQSNGQLVLKISDAFRPLSLQRKYFEEITEQIRRDERLDGRELWERVTQFIADPDLCPPHSTGGAVDLTIVERETGREIDMGTGLDCVDDRSNTWSDDVSPRARANRELLWRVMTDQGFVNLTSEWWHYSYGDQYWAIFTHQRVAIYGTRESV